MIPNDNEFSFLYFLYLCFLIFLLLETLNSKNKKIYKTNLFIYSCYTLFMLYLFTDENNFKGGGSLLILFYGLLFICIHIILLFLYKIFLIVYNKKI
jgi:hypothetical protein